MVDTKTMFHGVDNFVGIFYEFLTIEIQVLYETDVLLL